MEDELSLSKINVTVARDIENITLSLLTQPLQVFYLFCNETIDQAILKREV